MTAFLVGGSAFSGTTLLTLLLNQPGMVCLDEPDFQKPEQRHRGMPMLHRLVPDSVLPTPPDRRLSYEEAFDLFRVYAAAASPTRLGFKTCNYDFVAFAGLFRDAGLPVVAIVRDIRDVLVRSPDDQQTEHGLNRSFRFVWNNLGVARTWIRYEDLVRDATGTMSRVMSALAYDGEVRLQWEPSAVGADMLKYPRHALLRSGAISSERVGLWRTAGVSFSAETLETARLMGYGD
jgi:hypothetical protein